MMTNNTQQRIRRAFNQAQDTYDQAAAFQRQVAGELQQKLSETNLVDQEIPVILDIGAGTGYLRRLLNSSYPDSTWYGIDIADNLLRQANYSHCLCARAEQLPVADQSMDLILSNLCFQWVTDLSQVLSECKRVINPGGALLFSTLGENTLVELRTCWQIVDPDYHHVNHFINTDTLEDQLTHAGFTDITVQSVKRVQQHATVFSLLRHLQQLGANQVTQQQRRGLLGKSRLQSMIAQYERYRGDQSLLPATFEVLYVHAK